MLSGGVKMGLTVTMGVKINGLDLEEILLKQQEALERQQNEIEYLKAKDTGGISAEKLDFLIVQTILRLQEEGRIPTDSSVRRTTHAVVDGLTVQVEKNTMELAKLKALSNMVDRLDSLEKLVREMGGKVDACVDDFVALREKMEKYELMILSFRKEMDALIGTVSECERKVRQLNDSMGMCESRIKVLEGNLSMLNSREAENFSSATVKLLQLKDEAKRLDAEKASKIDVALKADASVLERFAQQEEIPRLDELINELQRRLSLCTRELMDKLYKEIKALEAREGQLKIWLVKKIRLAMRGGGGDLGGGGGGGDIGKVKCLVCDQTMAQSPDTEMGPYGDSLRPYKMKHGKLRGLYEQSELAGGSPAPPAWSQAFSQQPKRRPQSAGNARRNKLVSLHGAQSENALQHIVTQARDGQVARSASPPRISSAPEEYLDKLASKYSRGK